MRVGSSPLYLIPGQEYLLERFSQYLKNKEKDAFELLRTNKFLIDSKQDPAIRVALRSIKDFAIPFKEDDEMVWRYHTEKGTGFKLSRPIVQKREESIQKREEFVKEEIKEIEKPKQLDIFGEENKEPVKNIIKKIPIKTSLRKNTASQKKNEKFFNKVKEFLAEKSIGISDIEGFSKTDLILRIIDGGIEKILIAYNKKRIAEADLLKAYKKASEYNLSYIILSLGDPPKKLENLIEAIRKLSGIDKLD